MLTVSPKSLRHAPLLFGCMVATFSLVSTSSARPITAEVIMSGLNSPRGVAVGADGGVYVAEAGTGAFGTGNPNPVSVLAVSGDTEFYGATGSLSRYLGGTQSRILSNIPSLAGADGTSATGFQDIIFDANNIAYGVIGSPGNLSQRTTLASGGVTGNPFGRLVRLNTNSIDYLADFVAAEDPTNPDGGDVNSNPYGLIARAGGGLSVIDAGANALLNVAADLNTISLVTTFAPKANPLFGTPGGGGPFYQSVPTAVTTGLNGAYFISELAGYPFKQGGAQIYSVPAGGGAPTAVFSGFTTVIDLAFGADGYLYVLQLTQNGLGPESGGNPGPGQLIRVDPNTGVKTVLDVSLPSAPGGLLFSTGMAFGADGSLYVSNLGVSAGGGQVLRLTGVTVPETGSGWLALAALVPGAVVMLRRKK